MKILLFGANGNLGHDLSRALKKRSHDVIGADWHRMMDGQSVLDIKPDVIINAVAFNNVDGAESPENALILNQLNAELPKILAHAASEVGANFVHYSTDYVFDGAKQEGYTEDDMPNPLSAYARAKLAGEEAVRAMGGKWYLCRVSKLFGQQGTSDFSKPNFLTTMIRMAKEGRELRVVDEEVGSPTYTPDIAAATADLLEGNYPFGVYHFINEGPGVTMYQFVMEAFGILGIAPICKAVPRSEFPRAAVVPKYAQLLNTKFPKLRARQDALKAFFDENPEFR